MGENQGKATYNVDAYEGDEDFLSSDVLRGDGDTDNSDDEFTDAHANSAPKKESATTNPLNTPHSRDSHDYVDNACGNGDHEGI